MISMKIGRKFKPKKDEAIFWAGCLSTNYPKDPNASISMEGPARQFAAAHGKSTLEDHLDKYKIKLPDASKNRHSMQLKEKALKTFAQRAHGETHAYLGSYVRPGSVYTNMEKPILLGNPRITKLTEHRVHAGKYKVVKPAQSNSRSRSASPFKYRAGSFTNKRSASPKGKGIAQAAAATSRSKSLSPGRGRSRTPSRTRTLSLASRGRLTSRAGSPSRGRSNTPSRSRSNSPTSRGRSRVTKKLGKR
ncbi:hypothetical protein BDN70DRAFT_930339 [Pholiota conissans]|uniref:Uncharacterized protein n=1 Tax=Pholiota conissans TaxID=109636 RepID=A0A9P5Z8D7_9AGAR|nr:hypothetical protein BDN70DRAFT_930339 [Pholiota conissans]